MPKNQPTAGEIRQRQEKSANGRRNQPTAGEISQRQERSANSKKEARQPLTLTSIVERFESKTEYKPHKSHTLYAVKRTDKAIRFRKVGTVPTESEVCDFLCSVKPPRDLNLSPGNI